MRFSDNKIVAIADQVVEEAKGIAFALIAKIVARPHPDRYRLRRSTSHLLEHRIIAYSKRVDRDWTGI